MALMFCMALHASCGSADGPMDCLPLSSAPHAELHAIQQAVDERAAAHASGGGGSGGGGGQGGGHAPPRILVGGTALLNPHDLCCHMFADL